MTHPSDIQAAEQLAAQLADEPLREHEICSDHILTVDHVISLYRAAEAHGLNPMAVLTPDYALCRVICRESEWQEMRKEAIR